MVFKQADLLSLGTTLGSHMWDTALDSALLHCFPPELQSRYLAELQPHVRPYTNSNFSTQNPCKILPLDAAHHHGMGNMKKLSAKLRYCLQGQTPPP